ncbi:MAG: hypothetical protein ICV66_11040 [Chitinophagaceae bacterium]|nr:hypothetical protein [Chitinophagaceae bacterium]
MPESYSNEAIVTLIASIVLILLLAVTLVLIFLLQQKRKRLYKQQLKDMQNQYEKALLQSELKIQEETFQAIAQNLHDNIGSNVSTAMLLLYKDEHTTPEESEDNRKEALNIMDKVVDDLKNIARSMNPGYLDEIGLNEAIRHRIEQLGKLKKYDVELWLGNAPAKLNRQKQVVLFYIFQEAINNISKHAQAKRIEVALHYDNDKLLLSLKDDGIGIPETANKQSIQNKGSGLINIKHHAAMINATLNINGEPGKGTEINLVVPNPYV